MPEIKTYITSKPAIIVIASVAVIISIIAGSTGLYISSQNKKSEEKPNTKVNTTPTTTSTQSGEPVITATTAVTAAPSAQATIQSQAKISERLYFYTTKQITKDGYDITYDTFFAEYDLKTNQKKDIYTLRANTVVDPLNGINVIDIAKNGAFYFVTNNKELRVLKDNEVKTIYTLKKDYDAYDIYISNNDDVYLSTYFSDYMATEEEMANNPTELIKINAQSKQADVIFSNKDRVYEIINEDSQNFYLESYPTTNVTSPGDMDRSINVELGLFSKENKSLKKIGGYTKGNLSNLNLSNKRVVSTYIEKFFLGKERNDGNPFKIDILDINTGKSVNIYSNDGPLNVSSLGWLNDTELLFYEMNTYTGGPAGFNYVKKININTKQITEVAKINFEGYSYEHVYSKELNAFFYFKLNSPTTPGGEIIKVDLNTKQITSAAKVFNNLAVMDIRSYTD